MNPELIAFLDAIFGAETMPEDARDQIGGKFEAYELDTSSAAEKVVQLEAQVSQLQAELTAAKLFNYDKIMNGPEALEPAADPSGDGDPEQSSITTDDLFGEPGEDDDTDEDKDKD